MYVCTDICFLFALRFAIRRQLKKNTQNKAGKYSHGNLKSSELFDGGEGDGGQM